MGESGESSDRARRVLGRLYERQGELVAYLERLVRQESPSGEPAAQAAVLEMLAEPLSAAGYAVERIAGRNCAGVLYARPARRERGRSIQLIVGHCDTVWPLGTLRQMPLEREDGRLRGPGVYDMKGGLAQIVFALRTLRDLELEPSVSPVVVINSDEEIGSPESTRHIRRLAHRADRALVLEPALGPAGKLKTARKGAGRFRVQVRGRAAHAGLEPESGASAILELSHLIQKLHALNDRERGISVNVGLIDGGLRANMIAPRSQAQVDVRVLTREDADWVESAIHAMEPETPGTRLEIEGRVGRPPMERTPRNLALWELARAAGGRLGLDLEETTAGGSSDGNTTSQYTATLDGLGPVGDGAHAPHEFVRLESLVERSALLAELLMAPPLRRSEASR